jgi:rhodanese-related sulfurtransferase
MRLVIRIGLIVLGSLIAGIFFNMISSQGIHIRRLMLIFPGSNQCDLNTLEPDSALYLMAKQSAVFFDIRPERQFEIDHIPGAISVPAQRIIHKPAIPSDISHDLLWIFYDYHGKSKELKLLACMIQKKYKKEIFILEGGYAFWLIHEFPLEEGNGTRD